MCLQYLHDTVLVGLIKQGNDVSKVIHCTVFIVDLKVHLVED